MTKLERIVYNLKPIRNTFDVMKRIFPWGFQGLSLFEVCSFFFKELYNSKFSERAAAVTYNFLMAIPPTLLFLFSLVPYLPLKDVESTIVSTIQLISPNKEIRSSLSGIILDFMHRERKDLLSFGVLLTLYFSSNGMMGLIRGFDRALPVYVNRSGFQQRWTAIKLTFMLICMAVLTLVALIIQTNAVNELLEQIFGGVLAVKLLSMAIVILVIFCTISIIYTYGPSLTHRFEFVSPGSVFATLACVVTTIIFFFLVNNFLNYNKVYGPIGTLIAFLVWMWLNTLVILLGYELNVSILLGKFSHASDNKKSKTTSD